MVFLFWHCGAKAKSGVLWTLKYVPGTRRYSVQAMPVIAQEKKMSPLPENTKLHIAKI
jgi:hypothetical protein